MSAGKVKTLYSDKEKTEALFPRTKVSAVSDESGRGLDAIIADMESKIASNILDDSLYGSSLPSAAPRGAIFFKKVSG